MIVVERITYVKNYLRNISVSQNFVWWKFAWSWEGFHFIYTVLQSLWNLKRTAQLAHCLSRTFCLLNIFHDMLPGMKPQPIVRIWFRIMITWILRVVTWILGVAISQWQSVRLSVERLVHSNWVNGSSAIWERVFTSTSPERSKFQVWACRQLLSTKTKW